MVKNFIELLFKSLVNSTHNSSQNHAVKFESIKLVVLQSLLYVRLDSLLQHISSEMICIGPNLLYNSIQPLTAFNIGKEYLRCDAEKKGGKIHLKFIKNKCVTLTHAGKSLRRAKITSLSLASALAFATCRRISCWLLN